MKAKTARTGHPRRPPGVPDASRPCPVCGTRWSSRLVNHPAGPVVICVECGRVESATPPRHLTAAAG